MKARTAAAPLRSRAKQRPLRKEQVESLGRREAGKFERRRRIIEAARELIRETGNAGLSMRALAARAEVSLATPYNLFGSKRAIVLAVLEDVREYQERFANIRDADPIEHLFAAVVLALDYYKRDARFYKTLWAAVFDASDEVRADIFNYRRNAFWEELIKDAIKAGAIKDIDSRVLRTQLDFILRSAMFEWVVGEIDDKRLTPTVICGFSLTLKAVAAPAWRNSLHDRFLENQAKMLHTPKSR